MNPPADSYRNDKTRLIRLIGNFLTIICILYLVFLGFHLRKDLLKPELLELVSVGKILWGTLLWILVNLSGAVAWGLLIRTHKIESRWIKDIRIVFLTQIAKYLPGNVFHYAGRMVHYKANGIQFQTSGFLLLHEIALVASSALIIGVLATFFPHFLFLTPFALALASAAILFVFNPVLWKKKKIPDIYWGTTSAYTGISFCYVAASCLTSSIYFLLIKTNSFHESIKLLGASTLSWVIGFLTPGSPGGVGIREMVFTSIAQIAPKPTLVVAVVFLRLCSILGDAMCAFIALLLHQIEKYQETGKSD